MSRYAVVLPQSFSGAAETEVSINNALTRVSVDVEIVRIAKAYLPTDDSRRLVIVTDEAGGEVLAFLDSAGAWRRVTDRAVVS